MRFEWTAFSFGEHEQEVVKDSCELVESNCANKLVKLTKVFQKITFIRIQRRGDLLDFRFAFAVWVFVAPDQFLAK